MKKLKRRVAETLMEVLTAMAVFAIIIEGFSDFMANQTIALARAKDREKIMYYAQRWISSGDYSITSADNRKITFTSDDDRRVLTVKLNRAGEESSMQFRMK